MTIFFCCIPEDGAPPFLGADMLLSREQNPDEQFDIVSGRNEEIASHNRLLNQPWQKLYLFHPQIAFAVAGNTVHAQKFIDRIIASYESTSISPNEFFIQKAKNLWAEINGYEGRLEISFIFLIYDHDLNSFLTPYMEGCHEEIFGALGKTFYPLTKGVEDFRNKALIIANTEFGENIHSPEDLSVCRAMSLCYGLLMDESLGKKGETPLQRGIGIYYEFCYLKKKKKIFKYVDKTKILFWPFKFIDKPKIEVYFGHHSRMDENESEKTFRFYENGYDENGIRITSYENIEMIDNGHIMHRRDFRPGRFIASHYPASSKYSGKLIFNYYYMIDTQPKFIPNAFIKIQNIEERHWFEFTPLNDSRYEVEVKQPAYQFSIEQAHQFLENRWQQFDEKKMIEMQTLSKTKADADLIVRWIREGAQNRSTGQTSNLKKAKIFFQQGKIRAKKYALTFFVAEFTFLEGLTEQDLKNKKAAKLLIKSASEQFKNIGHFRKWKHCIQLLENL